jgi:ribonuclease HI
MQKIPRSAYHIYTDGSRDKVSLESGAAAVIRRNNSTEAYCEQYTGTETVNYAELHAILLGLKWISQNLANKTEQILHFWIDSQYAFRLLTEKDMARRHFFIVQDIMQLASHLQYSFGHSFIIHRISSHIDFYSAGACKIQGSIEADQRAQNASKHAAPFKGIEEIRLQILDQSAQLLQKISGLIFTKTAGPSESSPSDSDDFSVSATADQASESNQNPVLHPASVSGVS